MDENKRREEFAQRWLQAEPSISAYVFAAVSGFHDAEDMVQRVAQELARRFDEYDPDRPFIGWALWITKSRVIDFYRTQGRNRVVPSSDLLERLSASVADRSEGRSHRREALDQCLETLPDRSRKLLNLRYVDELPSEELAVEMGSTSGSVRVLLSRVRTVLSDCIQRRLAMEQPQ